MELLLTTLLPTPLHRLAGSFCLQALVAAATIAIVSASSAVATADRATVSPRPASVVAR
jgi:hypothetical protein